LEQNKDIDQFDIPLAKRTYLNNPNSILLKKLLIFSPFLFLIFSVVALRFIRNVELIPLNNLKFQVERNHDARILGHLPYNETPKEKLVLIEPNIEVHMDMRDSLLKMREQAKKDGIYLVFLSGYRSINLQNDIFYSLKSIRNQEAAERARVSAPPGYSEHSTGFAIDIGDATQRETDFETGFENTDAFRWLIKNAAKFHFKLSFNKDNKYIDYEPWHWRYEGSIEALKGKCNFGPHRDDVEFLINNVSIRKYGSSGQQRTFILALKMAELDLLTKTLNVPPMLILDDVLAELDLTRQNMLLNSVGKDSQCFISATHLDKFNQSFLGSSQMIHL